MAKKKETQEKAAAAVRKSFNLGNFKKKKGFSNASVKFKEQGWIPLSKAFQDITSLPGIPTGHITLLRGHSDTGKTTALLEAAVNAQKQGILPVFIISEMKWSWEHAREMGLEFTEVLDNEGKVIDYEGFFLYADRGTLNTIEEVAVHMADLIDEQTKGNLPYDMCFFWDSIGSIPCDLSVRSNKNNNVWTMKPEHPMGQPKLQYKGGMSMWYDVTLVVTFGNITNPGTSKIKAVKNGMQVEFAKRTNVQIEKNHIGGVQSRGRIVMTQHGFIEDDKRAIDRYKDAHKDHWLKLVGSLDFDLIEEGDLEEDTITPNLLD